MEIIGRSRDVNEEVAYEFIPTVGMTHNGSEYVVGMKYKAPASNTALKELVELWASLGLATIEE